MIDIEKAIETLKNYSPCSQKGLYEVHKIAISALEKQIAVKPKLQSKIDADCPLCSAPVRRLADHWCYNCGQKLDWSEVQK